MIETALYTIMTAHAGMNAINGGRVYYVLAPERVTLPFNVYQIISETPASAMGSDTGLVMRRVQVSSYASDSETAQSLDAQVVAALSRYSGTVDTTVIQDIYRESVVDLFDEKERLFHRARDFIVWYEE